MKAFSVSCPSCSHRFEPIEAQAQFIAREVDAALQLKLAEAEKKTRLEFTEKYNMKLKEMERQLHEKTIAINEAKQKAQIEETRKVEFKLKDLENQLKEREANVQKAHEQQLILTRKLREAQEREQKIDIEVEQKLMEKLDSVQMEAKTRAEDLYKLQLAQRDKKIKDIEQQLESARRTAEQGSQQSQGEIVEIEFEKQLTAKYPLDQFSPVPKGFDGADLVQTVVNSTGKRSGSIIWEFKNTKNFSYDWLTKLKNDQQKINADVAILVTKTLPKDIQETEFIDGVLIVSYALAIPLSAIVRKSIEDLSYAALVTQGQDEKMRLIYNYLTGNQFTTKVKSIVAAFKSLKEDLETEKRAFKKMWAAREKLLERVIDSASSLYGDIEGIAGSAAPKIDELEILSMGLLEESVCT